LQQDFLLAGEENCSLCRVIGIVVLAYLRWGVLCILLGVDDTLMWNRVLQHSGRRLLCILLLCLLWGRLRRRRGNTPRVFQPLEISDLRAMVSVMTIYST
jgi:hypothetical protein